MKLRVFFLFIYTFVYGQNQYPPDYFRAPLDIPLQLSGNFGELRPNHFHAGFDFKTQQKEGLAVYAAAEGYISRIKIAIGGYGKAIYVNHPNGYTTVYGHLKCGNGAIEKFIKSQQYNLQSYEMDVNLNTNELIVSKGDTIAFSGNTGGSEGPHLHFEIRDTTSEKIINPMFFGFDKVILDTKPPIINSLWVYPIDENSIVNQSKRPIAVNLSLQADGGYVSEKVVASGKIGFGITTLDLDNVSWSANGVYKVQTFVNGKSAFEYQFDTFSFDETKFINALIDYPRYKTLGQRVQKLFMKNPFSLSLIKSNSENGIITVIPNMTQTFRIEVMDFAGNTTKICVPIQFSNLKEKVSEQLVKTKYYVKAKRENSYTLENVAVFFPSNTFYDDFYLNFEVKAGVLNLHDNTIAAHSNFLITFQDSISTDNQKEKMFIALIDEKKIYFNTTKHKNNTFTTYTKYLGQYKLLKDTNAPKIAISKSIENKWISNQNDIQFSISDDLSGIKTYNGYLNGKWILLEYESKTKKIKHAFRDGIVAEGKNDLKIVVTDNVGNSTIFETHFFRSQKP